ncbi:hypothetical protein ANN_11391 [Periplaneta americana]|uniref:Transposase n=1 Tax=Periplaneta americana TaxID=6978 RepID=A0ABQ8T4W1_PERAM|nr:hypothetical protein ANN_11391 [Periplaneta americana]
MGCGASFQCKKELQVGINSRIIRQSSQPEASAPASCSGQCVHHLHGSAPSQPSVSLRQLREPGDGIAGIAADSLRINGAIRQFKQIARGKNARQCHTAFLEACGRETSLYRTLVRRAHAFRNGREDVHQKLGAGRPQSASDDVHVNVVIALLEEHRCWTCIELAREVGIAPVPAGNHVNGAYYSYFLEHHLRPAVHRERPNLLNSHPIVLLDGVRSHIANPVVNLLRRWNWEILEHPPYSPDESM